MHYIRFLKTPRVQVDRGSVLLKAVLAITTDLGETFYPEDIDLVITVRDIENDGDIYLRRKVQWKAGARSVPVAFNLSHQDVEWPACVHVAVKNSATANNCGFLPPICDVWSGLLNPTKGRMDSGRRVERRFMSGAEREVSLLEDAGDSIARHLWDGSQALAQHIDHTINMQTPTSLPLLEYVLISATYRKLNVLELGCGCGTVGISLAQAVPDCDVLLTDLPEVTELVAANIDRMKPAIASKVAFDALDWEQPLPERLQKRTNDLIIVSECTYNTDTLQPLVQTLLNLIARSPKAVIVVSTKTRHESEAAFFDMMKKAGLIEDGSVRLPLPGIPGHGYADWATDVGLHVFHGREHRLSLSPRGSDNEVPRAQRERPHRNRSE
ncbi:hypothetical protein LTR37_016158 [Vermiconidia calcicola]|uniref:Uncharacterized protein n=1 Tax=Vermiconidia calcicola TaxID=1690605 RepID=A0ACC3MNJ3_9PEZI|nr:hypothetical protein LTR37_016158 [Vermiconidia calcicola]